MLRCVVADWQIVLQKSKVAGRRIFRENPKRQALANSYDLNRITEVACEFNVRRRGPSHLYTKARLQPAEFLNPSAKRLLQQYRHLADNRGTATFRTRLDNNRHWPATSVARLLSRSLDRPRRLAATAAAI